MFRDFLVYLFILFSLIIEWILRLLNSLLKLRTRQRIIKSGQSEKSVNSLIMIASAYHMVIYMINYGIFYVCLEIAVTNKHKLTLFILMIVGIRVSLFVLDCVLNSKFLFPDNHKEELLDKMDVMHQSGFMLVLTIVFSISVIIDQEKASPYWELTWLLAMLPYTIFAMARQMNKARKTA